MESEMLVERRRVRCYEVKSGEERKEVRNEKTRLESIE